MASVDLPVCRSSRELVSYPTQSWKPSATTSEQEKQLAAKVAAAWKKKLDMEGCTALVLEASPGSPVFVPSKTWLSKYTSIRSFNILISYIDPDTGRSHSVFCLEGVGSGSAVERLLYNDGKDVPFEKVLTVSESDAK